MAAASVTSMVAAASVVGRKFRRGLSSIRIVPVKNTKQASKLSKIIPDASMIDTESGNDAPPPKVIPDASMVDVTSGNDASPSAANQKDSSQHIEYSGSFDTATFPDEDSYSLLESTPPASHIAPEDFDEDASVCSD